MFAFIMHTPMNRIRTIFLCAMVTPAAYGQVIKTDRSTYQHGDTITITGNFPAYKANNIHFASLYVFIENVDTKRWWAYRYPVVDGISASSLVVDSILPEGRYAFNFLTRKRFFSIQGTANNLPGSTLSYSMLTKKNDPFFGQTTTDADGAFSVRGVLFEDTCSFVFSPPKASHPINLNISIETPLDSTFSSDTSVIQFVYVGHVDTASKTAAIASQKDLETYFQSNTTLPGVTVTAEQKRKVDLFNEEYSTGLFRNDNARIFDGLENNMISQSEDIFQFLIGRVAGLQISMGNNGNYILQWQGPSSFRGGSNVDVFLDEFKVDRLTRGIVSPSEVAMVKAYPPPAFLSSGGQKGAIAIYTKRGGLENLMLHKNKFKVFGYTPLETVWK